MEVTILLASVVMRHEEGHNITSTESMRPCRIFFWCGNSPSPTGRNPRVWMARSFIW